MVVVEDRSKTSDLDASVVAVYRVSPNPDESAAELEVCYHPDVDAAACVSL